MTDPTITIAGLIAERDMLRSRLRDIAISVGAANEATCIGDASRARVAAERDALAAQLAEVRAELDRLRATDLTRDAAESTAADQLAILRADLASERADLASERAHLAACRTRIAGLEQAADERSRTPCNGSCDIALASRQVGPDGIVPRNARECAELWEREAARLWHDYLTVVDALAPSTSGPEHAAEIARDLRHRVAELEARPVLDEKMLSKALCWTRHIPQDVADDTASDVLRHLGPVTLPPAQDRAEELIAAYCDEFAARYEAEGNPPHMDRWHEVSAERRKFSIETMAATLAKLGAAPTAAPVDRAAAERVVREYHDTTPPAPADVFAGVSEAELVRTYLDAERADGTSNVSPGIRAVLARLRVTLVKPVDPEVVAKAIQGDLHRQDPGGWTTFDDISDGGQAEMVDAVRAALTAAGVPVTPERK